MEETGGWTGKGKMEEKKRTQAAREHAALLRALETPPAQVSRQPKAPPTRQQMTEEMPRK